MATELLSDADINDALSDLPDWKRRGGTITRMIKAPSFLEGIELVRQVAEAAEAADHHPDIDIRWRRITFALSTHSAGGLTGRDMMLAHQIDQLATS
jgi:4a-hydroxytetrahydrobiopterin dehydratase